MLNIAVLICGGADADIPDWNGDREVLDLGAAEMSILRTPAPISAINAPWLYRGTKFVNGFKLFCNLSAKAAWSRQSGRPPSGGQPSHGKGVRDRVP